MSIYNHRLKGNPNISTTSFIAYMTNNVYFAPVKFTHHNHAVSGGFWNCRDTLKCRRTPRHRTVVTQRRIGRSVIIDKGRFLRIVIVSSKDASVGGTINRLDGAPNDLVIKDIPDVYKINRGHHLLPYEVVSDTTYVTANRSLSMTARAVPNFFPANR